MDAHTVEAFAFCALEDATAPFYSALEEAFRRANAAVSRALAAGKGGAA
jgi:hypothetical protein